MTKNHLIGGIVVVAVVAGGIWYTMNSDVTSTQSSESIASLAAKSGSWRCDVAHTGENHATGIVFISGGKVQGDFNTDVPLGETQAHMISDNEYVYIWRSGMSTGFKSKLTVGSSGSADDQDFYYQTYTYRCSPWSPDNTKFTLPSNITFTELFT